MTNCVRSADSNDQTVTLQMDVSDVYKLARMIESIRLCEAFDIAERIDRSGDSVSPFNAASADVRRLMSLGKLFDIAVRDYNELV